MACVILLVVLLILFILMELMPGSPFSNPEITPDQRARIEKIWVGPAVSDALFHLLEKYAARRFWCIV